MASSEEVAWSMYADLPIRDRREVDAWRSLGNDLVTSLLNSGVLSPGRGAAGPAPASDEWRRYGTGADYHLRLTAEHEAAHAVVARALGIPVSEILIRDDNSGVTRYEATGAAETAAIAAAADVWISEFRSLTFPGAAGAGCRDDVQVVVRNTGDQHGVAQAMRSARLLLAQRRGEVLELADELVCKRHITFERGEA